MHVDIEAKKLIRNKSLRFQLYKVKRIFKLEFSLSIFKT